MNSEQVEIVGGEFFSAKHPNTNQIQNGTAKTQ